jgi:hypothetical protein
LGFHRQGKIAIIYDWSDAESASSLPVVIAFQKELMREYDKILVSIAKEGSCYQCEEIKWMTTAISKHEFDIKNMNYFEATQEYTLHGRYEST